MIAFYLPQIIAIATECGLFFVIKAILQRKLNESISTDNTLKKQLEVLIHDNAELRKQNRHLIDKLIHVKNGSEHLE